MLVKKTLLTAISMWILCVSIFADNESDKRLYIERYKEIAVEHHKVMGIPASIKLAQALLESSFGRSSLATEANNHFGIKCKSDWTGQSFYKKDDDFDEEGNLTESCFRSYGSAEESFIDHSLFLKSNARYAELFTYGSDYKKWAKGLQKAGYATAPDYANRLISIIEEFELYQYDNEGYTGIVGDTVKVKNEKPVLKPGETRNDSWSTSEMREPHPVKKPDQDAFTDEDIFDAPKVKQELEAVPFDAPVQLGNSVSVSPKFSSPDLRAVRRR
ncbi:MAG: glucosaminidase domain-containing protein [Saprospiraceae bacterium]